MKSIKEMIPIVGVLAFYMFIVVGLICLVIFNLDHPLSNIMLNNAI